ncbi:MAG: hypothetical protein U9P71_00905 [Campylobacterota bacterium]|nr:hypothetical protein [Campylobacterota bacterium]
MKLIILFIITFTLSHADQKQDVIDLYKSGKYKESCLAGLSIIDKNSKDESFVTLYAFACLNSDYIDRLNLPISKLKFSKEARSNAAYFSIILMQKKLLLHSLADNYDISDLKLPSTSFILSRVFDLYSKAQHGAKHYHFNDPQKDKVSYELYLKKQHGINKIVIEEFYDKILTKRHFYW